MLRPLFSVNNMITNDDIKKYSWKELVHQNKIVYLIQMKLRIKLLQCFLEKLMKKLHMLKYILV